MSTYYTDDLELFFVFFPPTPGVVYALLLYRDMMRSIVVTS